MLSKLLSHLYNKVLITIIVEQSQTYVKAEVCSRKKVLQTEVKSFETTSLNDDMYKFISHYTAQSPYYYVALLDPSEHQHAFGSCLKSHYSMLVDVEECEIKCIEDAFGVCTTKDEIIALEKRYEGLGLDMLFSPVIVLRKFYEDKIQGSLAMYVLIEEARLTLCIFEESQLQFSKQVTLIKNSDSDVDELFVHDDEEMDTLLDEDLEDLEDGIDLEELNVNDDIEDLEDFGNIEDLEALDDLDQFSDKDDIDELDDLEMLDEQPSQKEDDKLQDREDDFNQEFQRFSFIESSVKQYYEDDRYESQFLENVYIADGVGVSSDLRKYLEEEMFFNVFIRQIDVVEKVSELAKEELGL